MSRSLKPRSAGINEPKEFAMLVVSSLWYVCLVQPLSFSWFSRCWPPGHIQMISFSLTHKKVVTLNIHSFKVTTLIYFIFSRTVFCNNSLNAGVRRSLQTPAAYLSVTAGLFVNLCSRQGLQSKEPPIISSWRLGDVHMWSPAGGA